MRFLKRGEWQIKDSLIIEVELSNAKLKQIIKIPTKLAVLMHYKFDIMAHIQFTYIEPQHQNSLSEHLLQ